jgi:hypothetical protein
MGSLAVPAKILEQSNGCKMFVTNHYGYRSHGGARILTPLLSHFTQEKTT